MQSTDGLLQRKPQASQLQTSLNEDNNMTYHDVDLSKPIPSSAIYGKVSPVNPLSPQRVVGPNEVKLHKIIK